LPFASACFSAPAGRKKSLFSQISLTARPKYGAPEPFATMLFRIVTDIGTSLSYWTYIG
jgi:hypothetical protein